MTLFEILLAWALIGLFIAVLFAISVGPQYSPEPQPKWKEALLIFSLGPIVWVIQGICIYIDWRDSHPKRK